MLFYILFCYFVAAIYVIYQMQTNSKQFNNLEILHTYFLSSLLAPRTVTLAFILVPLWYIIAYIRKRFITKG